MKNKRTLQFMILIFALLVACNDDDSNVRLNDSNNYFPLTIGNSWEYRGYQRKVTGTREINGKDYFVFSEQTKGKDGYFSIYLREDFYRSANNKIYKLYHDQSGEFLYIDFTLREDENWTYQTSDDDDQEWHVKVLPEHSFTIGNQIIHDCKPFFYDVPQWADEEHRITFAPGLGEISTYSTAWGIGDTLQKATINGIRYQF